MFVRRTNSLIRVCDVVILTCKQTFFFKSKGDVIEQIYSALLQPITAHENAAHVQANGHSRMPNATRTSGHKRAAVLGKRTAWLGLVRDRGEMDDGLPVREMPTGEIDGGTWWLKLKKP